MKTGDLRYLLDCGDDLPEFDIESLEDTWDNILKEYDELTGQKNFQTGLEDVVDLSIDANRITGLKACFEMMLIGSNKALKLLKYWGVEYEKISTENILNLKRLIIRENTKYKIASSKHKSINGLNDKQNSWIKCVVDAKNVLKRDIDAFKITVEEWVFTEKSISKMLKPKTNG